MITMSVALPARHMSLTHVAVQIGFSSYMLDCWVPGAGLSDPLPWEHGCDARVVIAAGFTQNNHVVSCRDL